MKEQLYHRALPALLAGALVLTITISHPEIAAMAGSPSDSLGQAADSPRTETQEQSTGLEGEKEYLLEALNFLQEKGLSPIMIWSEVTRNPKVVNMVNGVTDSVAETARDKARDVGDAAADALKNAGDKAAEKASDAIQEQTEKAKKSLIERIREALENFFQAI